MTLDGKQWPTRSLAVKHSEVMMANAAGYLASALAQCTKYWEIKEYLVSPIGMARMRELIKWVEECEGVRVE